MNLPKLYAKVVEKHPGLEVRDAILEDDKADTDRIARALIADHWTEMLPPACALRKMMAGTDSEWFCGNAASFGKYSGATRLEALAAFWLAYEGTVTP